MAVVSVSNFPDELYEQLVRRAADNRRRIDDEIVEAARRMLAEPARAMTVEEKLNLADSVRTQTSGACVTEEFIRQARDEGRA
jgi:plasmid stability protein